MSVKIKRICTSELGTFGVLLVDDLPFCVTLEDPDRNNDGIVGNERNQSCIPAGRYKCAPYPSQKFGMTYIVQSVPGRMGILFHAGNSHHNTTGCILLGEKFGLAPDKTPLILESVSAVKRFLARFDGEFWLSVEKCY